MNKIEKIRAEIERLKKNSELAKMEWINEGYASAIADLKRWIQKKMEEKKEAATVGDVKL